MGKQNLYDAAMKVPLIFAGPGIPRGESEALVYLLDIYPTACDLARAPVPRGIDGISLIPVIRGESKHSRSALLLAYRDVQRAVRDSRWKLVRYPQVDRTQLFDLRTDPDESRDLSADPAQAGRIGQMAAKLRELQKQFGDGVPWTADNPKRPEWTPPARK